MCYRNFIAERSVDTAFFEKSGIVDLLKEQHLYRSVSDLAPFVTEVVLEFYGNLIKDMFDPHADDYGKAFVREVFFEFTPAVINEYLGRGSIKEAMFIPDYDEIINTLTGGVSTTWGKNKSFPASKLTSKYEYLNI